MQSALVETSSAFTIALTADLLLTIPLVYFLLIRKTSIPKTTVVPVMVIGFLLGSYFLPKESQTYLLYFKTWALPVIEISVFSYIVYKVRKVIVQYRALKGESVDFFAVLKQTCEAVLPKKIVVPFTTEIAVLYYGFVHWKTIHFKDNEFSYHKNSGSPALLFAFIFVVLIETFAVHILLDQWNAIVAWILTGLSLYTGLQVFGFAKSMFKRPITIEENTIRLRYGIMSETDIELNTIKAIELSYKPVELDDTMKRLSILGEMESHNVLIHLNEPATLKGLYGKQSSYTTLLLHVDEPKRFEAYINNQIEQHA